ncbi:Altered inheritance of mitochondria protein 32 [Symbiodinium microadriaticum]|uniref:Altered inheritance of mitochondria protein 32 n=2 Tax=Symbiodinium TaxID=2949 RepID=A0A1Q9CSV9_SYMMI|nr:Altered inheritance of mitochondria protein 32 [Symbiodinium microadriaticum]CAE7691759.1 AIM32 [Symbiodinium sp. KB8]CAE7909727.1 AIM32 [Symbiodinium microadriaticum]
MAEVGVGFERPELNSEPLAGSVKSYDKHVFLLWGLASDWPEDPFDGQHEGTLPVRLSKAIKAEKQIKSKVRVSLVEATSTSEEGCVLVFPDYIRCDIGRDGTGIPELVRYLTGDQSAGSSVQDIEDAFAFVCAHTKRDERCGHCGPRLVESATRLVKTGAAPAMQVRKCSHVGGHKYAGNIIIYSGKASKDDGHWYGYATPDNLQTILTGRALRSHLWRGRLGISESAAVAERKRQVFLNLLPGLGLVVLIGIGSYAWLRRRKS